MLGYFSLIGLLRVHSVLGDHIAGMKALAPLNPNLRKDLFATKIAMAAITMAYYCGFGYLMMHRYLDAADLFNFGVMYVSKVKNHARGVTYDHMLKKNEQMYAALAITSSLCPVVSRRLDEAASSALREKYGEKIRAMNSGSFAAYEELFAYSCPKFTSAQAPDWSDATANSNLAAFKSQLARFMEVLEERKHLPAIKQVLKLYSSIPISKLATLAEMSADDVRKQLDLLLTSSKVLTWVSGDALSGEAQYCSDLDFSVEKLDGEEYVVAKESKGASIKGDFLIKHIQKFNDIIRDLKSTPAPVAPAAAAN